MATGETTIVVELCDRLEDLAAELVQKTAARLGGQSGQQLEAQCMKRVQTGDLRGLVDALVAPLTGELMTPVPQLQPGQVPTLDTPMTPETAFSLFLVLMRRLPVDVIPAIVTRACEGLTSSRENVVVRSRCLSSLFSALQVNSKSRYIVFKALVEYVGDKSAVTENLDAERVGEMCASWGESSPEKIRALHLSIADAFKTTVPVKSQQALLAYLATFRTPEEAAANADSNRVRECAINAIRDPVSSSRDFSALHSVAMQRLKRDDPMLHQLLEIVCGDSLEKYASFSTANPAFEKMLGIDHDKTFEKMRLLALAALGSDSDRALSYEEVAKALRIDNNEVEAWIIKAIGAGVVDAKMDQVNGTVVVHRAAQRVFNDEQWIRLSAQLKKWRASVRNVLQTVQNARDHHQSVTGGKTAPPTLSG